MDDDDASVVWGVSVRAWLSVLIIGTVCAISIMYAIADIKSGTKKELKIGEPLYTMAGMALGFYYGQKFGRMLGRYKG